MRRSLRRFEVGRQGAGWGGPSVEQLAQQRRPFRFGEEPLPDQQSDELVQDESLALLKGLLGDGCLRRIERRG